MFRALVAVAAQNNPTYGTHLPFPFSLYPLAFLIYLVLFVFLILFTLLVIIIRHVLFASHFVRPSISGLRQPWSLVEGDSSAPNFLTTRRPAPVSSAQTQPLAQPKCQQLSKMTDGTPATVTSLKDLTPQMISLFTKTYSEKIYFQHLKVNKHPIPSQPEEYDS